VPDATSLTILAVFFIVWLFFLWVSARKARAYKPSTHLQYLWRLKEITEKSEYELFQIAAEEKGWPGYHLERDFNRYLQDQTLPAYVKEFLEDGRQQILAYGAGRSTVYDRKLMVFYAILGLILLGGTLAVCLWLLPKI
jgi:cell division protein FtsI/penicillin-binding protein 2